MMRVTIATASRFSASEPDQVFENGQLVWERVRNYDLMPNGDFVMVRRDNAPTRSLRVVLDWFDEWERLAPTGAQR
jgi:hypothetical protein